MQICYLALLCGLIATSFVDKSESRLHAESIVGGNIAAVNQNTYAVSIQKDDLHFCGGAILNNRHIITAAHCFINPETNRFENKEYIVVAGITNAHNNEQQYRVAREVAKIYIPRQYNLLVRNNKIDDIAVLKLKSYLGFHQFVTNVVLPRIVRSYPTYENQQAVVCGYGHNWMTMHHDEHTNEDVEVCSGSHSYERRFAEVNIISNVACRHFYTDLLDSHLCGHMSQRCHANPEGVCVGDSGSPLVIGNTIVGIVAGSPMGCREDLQPAIYTRVTSFIPFIQDAMNCVREAHMRVAKYEIKACGLLCHNKVLVEQ